MTADAATPQGTVCPHCNASYPSLAKHAGRHIRCRECKQPFTILADGSAIPYQAEDKPAAPGPDDQPGPAQPVAAEAESAEAAQPVAAEAESAEAAQPEASEAVPDEVANTDRAEALERRDDDNTDAERRRQSAAAHEKVETERRERQKRRTEILKRRNQQVAQDLNKLAQEALKTVDPGPATKPPTTNRTRNRTGGTSRHDRASSRMAPVLTDSGRAAGRERLLTTLIGLALLSLLVLLGAWLFQGPGPLQSALDQAVRGQARGLVSAEPGQMARERCVLGPDAAAPITSLEDTRFAPVEQLPLAPLRELIGDRRPLVRRSLWVPARRLAEAAALLEHWPEPLVEGAVASAKLREQFAEAELPITLHSDLLTEVRALTPGGELFAELLDVAGPIRPDLIDLTRILVEDDSIPALERARFTGSGGVWHLPNDRRLTVAYRGFLIRQAGPGEPGPWQLGRLQAR